MLAMTKTTIRFKQHQKWNYELSIWPFLSELSNTFLCIDSAINNDLCRLYCIPNRLVSKSNKVIRFNSNTKWAKILLNHPFLNGRITRKYNKIFDAVDAECLTKSMLNRTWTWICFCLWLALQYGEHKMIDSLAAEN